MFDRLIESDATGADIKSRRRYFFVSSVVVGSLFVSAVIFSIYAAEVGLGNNDFELSTLIAPSEPPQIEPEPPRPQSNPTSNRQSTRPTRVVEQQRIDEPPISTPTYISTAPNKFLSRPDGIYELDNRDTDPPPIFSTGNNIPGTGASDSTASTSNDRPAAISEDRIDRPPPAPVVPKTPKHLGVVNGRAVELPKPPYPPVALAAGIQGKVDVQVTIDETGKVVSARAASGHMLLRDTAERFAWRAQFTPTVLNGVPVKVTGVIVYNFTRN